MSTPFDGSTGQPVLESAEVEHLGTHDTLGLLRQAVAEQVPIEPTVIDIPGGVGIRLVCTSDISSKQIQSWQQRALPKHLRNTSNVSPLSMNQLELATAVLVNTLLRIEVRDRRDHDVWHVIEGTDGDGKRPLGFNDTALLQQFGAMDTITALRKLFGRESAIVHAGQAVMVDAGWAGDRMVTDDDVDADSDPS